MNKLIKKNPYLFCFLGLLLLVFVITYLVSDSTNDKNGLSIVELFFNDKPNYNFLSNLNGSTFKPINLMTNEVYSGSKNSSNLSEDNKIANRISYTYNRIYKNKYNSSENNNIQQINLYDLNKTGDYSHQNNNAFQPVSELPNLALSDFKKGFLEVSKGNNITKKNDSNEASYINSDLLVPDNSLTSNTVEDKVGVDPNGDPTTDPIPIGDGYLFLFVLVIGKTILKLKS